MPHDCSDGQSSDTKGNSAGGEGGCTSDGGCGSGRGDVVNGSAREVPDSNAPALDLVSVSGSTIVASELGGGVG